MKIDKQTKINILLLFAAIVVIGFCIYLKGVSNFQVLAYCLVFLKYGVPIAIILLQARALRNLYVFCAWLLIAICIKYLWDYFFYDIYTFYHNYKLVKINDLDSVFIFLVAYQILRQLSKFLFNTELIIELGTLNRFDSNDNRRLNYFDFISELILFIIILKI